MTYCFLQMEANSHMHLETDNRELNIPDLFSMSSHRLNLTICTSTGK